MRPIDPTPWQDTPASQTQNNLNSPSGPKYPHEDIGGISWFVYPLTLFIFRDSVDFGGWAAYGVYAVALNQVKLTMCSGNLSSAQMHPRVRWPFCVVRLRLPGKKRGGKHGNA